MDSTLSLFFLQITLYSIFPFYLSRLKKPLRSIAFYIYISLILLLGGFVGSVFSLQISESVVISSGNIAYAALMMTTIFFVIIERNLFIFRGIIRLVITVNVFKILVFSLIFFSLQTGNTVNPYNTSAKIFDVSVPFTILGGVLIVSELIFLFYIFELIKSKINNTLLISGSYLLFFILVLCIDGAVFPVIAFGTSSELINIIIGNAKGKFIVATAFSIPIAIYFYVFRDNLKLYTNAAPFRWELLPHTSEKVMQKILEKERKLQQASAVFDHTNEGVILTDESFNVVNINNAFEKMLGLSGSTINLKGPNIRSFVEFSKENFSEVLEAVNSANFWKGEVLYKGESNRKCTGLVSINPIKDASGNVTNHVVVLTDITEIRNAQEQLVFLANHDPLTGLSNRRVLLEQIERSLNTASRSDHKLALLIIDLDHFKDVNDSYGHQFGDELLIDIGQTLSKRARPADTLCRLGGDEFAVLIEKVSLFDEAAHIADSIINSLSGPWKLSNNVQVHVGATIGISLYPDHGDTASLLMQNADAALYKAKRIQRGTYEFFTQDMTNAARKKIELEMRLRKCVEDKQLDIVFQPQVNIATGKISGVEALVRWNDPIEGFIDPEKFIPLAESIGLIEEIGVSVLKEACSQGKAWTDAGNEPLSISVNLSSYQFRHTNVVDVVENILKETDFPPEFLELELTESLLLEREVRIIPMLNALRTLGISIAIDDFGTGYSSLAYLRRYPIDRLKIDKSFIDDVSESSVNNELVSTIILMGHNLGFHVIAEGVETEYQLAFLKKHHCDSYQGYIISPPVSGEVFSRLYRDS